MSGIFYLFVLMDAGCLERLKVKDKAVLSLTILDPMVMSHHISVSKCVLPLLHCMFQNV